MPKSYKKSHAVEALVVFYLVSSVFVAAFALSHRLSSLLFRLDSSLNHQLHIRQTDIVWGYWALFLPSALVTTCIWLSRRLFTSKATVGSAYHLATEIASLAAAPVAWLVATYVGSHRYGWTVVGSYQFYEVLVVLAAVLSLSRRNFRYTLWLVAAVTCLHFLFWMKQFGSLYFLDGNQGAVSVLPILGLLSTIAWFAFRPGEVGRGTSSVSNSAA